MSLDFQVASLSYKSSSFATSRGNEKIGGTGHCVTYDTDSQSRNVLASPLGEEGHEVAKGWTRVILIMILDVDVTAEGVSHGGAAPFFNMTIGVPAATVISSGAACRYERQTVTAPMML